MYLEGRVCVFVRSLYIQNSAVKMSISIIFLDLSFKDFHPRLTDLLLVVVVDNINPKGHPL